MDHKKIVQNNFLMLKNLDNKIKEENLREDKDIEESKKAFEVVQQIAAFTKILFSILVGLLHS